MRKQRPCTARAEIKGKSPWRFGDKAWGGRFESKVTPMKKRKSPWSGNGKLATASLKEQKKGPKGRGKNQKTRRSLIRRERKKSHSKIVIEHVGRGEMHRKQRLTLRIKETVMKKHFLGVSRKEKPSGRNMCARRSESPG